MKKVYLDHNATTPVHRETIDAMLPFLAADGRFGNPSSLHWAGREAREAVERARQSVAALIGAWPDEIFFTSGGTEGDNMAIKGVLFSSMKKTGKLGHVVTTAIEHPAVLHVCRQMEEQGFGAAYAPVDGQGMADPADVKKAVRPDTVLVSVMYANNETGNILPVSEMARMAHEKGVIFHTDAVQAVGKAPIDVKVIGADILTASGHKFGAPKGIGFQYVRRDVQPEIWPLIAGGGQEKGLRGGTENVPGIIALGKACEIAQREMAAKAGRIKKLRDRLEDSILKNIPETVLNGHKEKRIYNTSNISFKYIEADAILTMLDMKGIAVSTGSACSSGDSEPSHVLTAMGLGPVRSRGALRFSLGHDNTEEDVDYCIEALAPIVERLLAMSPLYKQ
ncbi:MAG: aminotransferase class V-fold PLP-dependent enzyme [Nitrospiraceae bacterium]|nr:aminotransferase class V-fold PLP-dependent enzyme [Nitrospiraceae bacterium]